MRVDSWKDRVVSFGSRATLTNATLAAAVLLAAPGCAFIDDLEDSGGIVDVFTAHHGTPADGVFPEQGEAGMARAFTTDSGWSVVLGEAYLTTAGVELAGCSGGIKRVDLFWGPSAESLVDIADAEPRGIGGVRTPADKFCQLRVTYGPYSFAAAETEGAEYAPPSNELMEGQTILLRGYATKDGENVPFEYISDLELSVVRDISTLQNGRPLTVKTDQSFPAKIVLAKTYDRFFDGVDFLDYTDDDIEAAVIRALEGDSRVIFDVKVEPPPPSPPE